ncbi:Methylcrotonyl-CoA carboxylase biotin-containing subunit protein [Minicystis rosea]|nr:Methylcrotonyl-CoA carboxylase biotin-containing subunit protein [Minicystis rosea]
MLRITHLRGRMAPAIEHFAARRLRIGSAAGSELLFAAHEGVAPAHAELRDENGVVYVVDMGAPSGTFINGVPVRKQALRSGDRVAVAGAHGPEFRVDILPQTGQMPAVGHRAQPVPDVDGRIDLATAERLVAEAVRRETAGDDKTTSVVAAKVAAARKRSSRYNLVLSVGLGLVFVAMVVTAASIWRSHLAADSLGKDIGIDRKPVSRPKSDIPTRVLSGREIADENRTALYVIGWQTGNRYGGVCSGFAIQPNIIATNAHCINAFKDKGGTPIVTQNESGGRVRYRILAAQKHPQYKSGQLSAASPDVGLIRIDGRMPKTVTLANDAEIRALGPGDDAYVLGFPGRVMDPLSPSATFLQGHVGRLMAFGEGAPNGVEDAVLIQHDAVTRGGNSGSPIFNQYGHVIGVHAAHLDEENEIQVGGQKTTVVGTSPFRVGMRIDLLNGVPSP